MCGPGIVKKYLNKISGPLLDRIDLHVEVTPVSYDELSTNVYKSESSNTIRERVKKARIIQDQRFADHPYINCNAQMPSRMVETVLEDIFMSSCRRKRNDRTASRGFGRGATM